MGHQTLLLRLSAVLRNAVVMYTPRITPDNCWHKTTWPEIQPSLPLGQPQTNFSQTRAIPGRSRLRHKTILPPAAMPGHLAQDASAVGRDDLVGRGPVADTETGLAAVDDLGERGSLHAGA